MSMQGLPPVPKSLSGFLTQSPSRGIHQTEKSFYKTSFMSLLLSESPPKVPPKPRTLPRPLGPPQEPPPPPPTAPKPMQSSLESKLALLKKEMVMFV